MNPQPQPDVPPMIGGLLFDKDGTLFDFQETWGGWAADLMLRLAGGDARNADRLADLLHLDRARRIFHPGSPAIAGTSEETARVLLPGVPHLSFADLLETMQTSGRLVRPVEAVPLLPLLIRLRAAGFVLGVATNDDAASAQVQLNDIGALGLFDFLAGADSGYGAKPAPGQCLAFAEAAGLAPRQVAMIGDSTHDLRAGQAAGMATIGVLTGPALQEELLPHATAVLPDIGHLPAWLGLS